MRGATVNDVPLTFPAHQAAVLPLKLWRPRWFDGTALVVGSGAPDLFNAFAFVDTFDSHHWDGFAFAVPFTVIYSVLLRRFAVDGLFGSMPDFGPLRARSYRVLSNGRPRVLVTVLSALIGVASHIALDSFTHPYRIGSNLLGLHRVLFDGPFGPVTGAKFLQYLGHSFGSLIGVMLFVLVVSRRHLGEWYGHDAVAEARRAPVRDHARARAVSILVVGIVAGLVWGLSNEQFPIFHLGLTLVISLLVIGVVNRPTPITEGQTLSYGGGGVGAATLATCPDISIPHATTSSMRSDERSPRI